MNQNTVNRITKVGMKFLTNRNILILLICTIGMLPTLISFGRFFINGDITSQMLPFVYETKRMFSSGVPFWSWNTYFGDNFIGSYAYYTVFNPFTWINCIFPYKYLGLGFTIVLYLKFLLCGYVAQKYLKKIGFDEKLSLIGCLLYTFSSWAITNLYYYMFMESMILFPFLLIFVERFLRKERHSYSGLSLAVFVVVAVNYYFAAVNLIAAAIYFFCRLFLTYEEKKERIRIILKAAGCVALGIFCSSVVLMPVLMQLHGSEHQSVDHNHIDFWGFADRLFWLLYPKTSEASTCYLYLRTGAYSHAANIAVFGLLPTILLFTKKGFVWIKWLTGIMAIIYLSPLNGLFSLFTENDYTRWAYSFSLAIIICTLYYIKNYGLPRLRSALWYCAVVYGVYYLYAGASAYWQYFYAGYWGSKALTIITMGSCVVTVNMIVLLLLCGRKSKYGMSGSSYQYKSSDHNYTVIIVAVTICTSLQFISFSYIETKEYGPKHFLMTETDYFRYGEDLLTDQDFSYRTNFNLTKNPGWTTNNFALICNRPSVETFHSVQNAKIQKWNDIVSDSWSRVFRPLHFMESFEVLMSVKELVLASNDSNASFDRGKLIGKNGHFTIYESDRYIPMGFTYDSYVLSDSVENLALRDTTADIPKILLSSLAIDKEDENDLSPYLRKGRIDKNVNLDSLVSVRKAITCDSFRGQTRGFDAHINLDSTSVVFFSVVADNGFKAYIDGVPTKIYETNLGFSSVIVPIGSHDITFRYFTPGLKIGLIITIIGWIIWGLICFRRK